MHLYVISPPSPLLRISRSCVCSRIDLSCSLYASCAIWQYPGDVLSTGFRFLLKCNCDSHGAVKRAQTQLLFFKTGVFGSPWVEFLIRMSLCTSSPSCITVTFWRSVKSTDDTITLLLIALKKRDTLSHGWKKERYSHGWRQSLHPRRSYP